MKSFYLYDAYSYVVGAMFILPEIYKCSMCFDYSAEVCLPSRVNNLKHTDKTHNAE